MTLLTPISLATAVCGVLVALHFVNRTIRAMLVTQRQLHDEVWTLRQAVEQNRSLGYQRDSHMMEKLEQLEPRMDLLQERLDLVVVRCAALDDRVAELEKRTPAVAPARRGMNVGGDTV